MSYEESLLEKAKMNKTPHMSVVYPIPAAADEELLNPVMHDLLDTNLTVEMHEMSGRQHLFSDDRHFEDFDPFEHEDVIHKIVSEVLK